MPRNSKITAADLPYQFERELLGSALNEKPKRNKYKTATKEERTVDGIVFDSKREMTRYSELRILESSGAIRNLEMQVRYDLHVSGGSSITYYVADFRYLEGRTRVIEDAKGMKTRMYLLKKKWMKAEYGIELNDTLRVTVRVSPLPSIQSRHGVSCINWNKSSRMSAIVSHAVSPTFLHPSHIPHSSHRNSLSPR